MIKTIDTNEITEKMFQAFRDNYVDATRCIFAVLAAATAVEPAQAVPVGYCLMPREPTQWMREQIACGIESNSVADVWGRLIRAVDIENKHRAKEPAQAVPVDDEASFRDYACRCKTLWAGLDWDNQVVEIAREAYLAGRKNPAPPAIDDETKRMVLELCRLIIDKAGPDSMITRAMAQKAEKISERLEAGE